MADDIESIIREAGTDGETEIFNAVMEAREDGLDPQNSLLDIAIEYGVSAAYVQEVVSRRLRSEEVMGQAARDAQTTDKQVMDAYAEIVKDRPFLTGDDLITALAEQLRVSDYVVRNAAVREVTGRAPDDSARSDIIDHFFRTDILPSNPVFDPDAPLTPLNPIYDPDNPTRAFQRTGNLTLDDKFNTLRTAYMTGDPATIERTVNDLNITPQEQRTMGVMLRNLPENERADILVVAEEHPDMMSDVDITALRRAVGVVSREALDAAREREAAAIRQLPPEALDAPVPETVVPLPRARPSDIDEFPETPEGARDRDAAMRLAARDVGRRAVLNRMVDDAMRAAGVEPVSASRRADIQSKRLAPPDADAGRFRNVALALVQGQRVDQLFPEGIPDKFSKFVTDVQAHLGQQAEGEQEQLASVPPFGNLRAYFDAVESTRFRNLLLQHQANLDSLRAELAATADEIRTTATTPAEPLADDIFDLRGQRPGDPVRRFGAPVTVADPADETFGEQISRGLEEIARLRDLSGLGATTPLPDIVARSRAGDPTVAATDDPTVTLEELRAILDDIEQGLPPEYRYPIKPTEVEQVAREETSAGIDTGELAEDNPGAAAGVEAVAQYYKDGAIAAGMPVSLAAVRAQEEVSRPAVQRMAVEDRFLGRMSEGASPLRSTHLAEAYARGMQEAGAEPDVIQTELDGLQEELKTIEGQARNLPEDVRVVPSDAAVELARLGFTGKGAVRRFQSMMRDIGDTAGPIDNVLGPLTWAGIRRAIRKRETVAMWHAASKAGVENIPGAIATLQAPAIPDIGRFIRSTVNNRRVLRKGWLTNTEGSIGQWQRWLRTMGYTDHKGQPVEVDGRMTRATMAATKKFQADHGIAQDGLPGPITGGEALTEHVRMLKAASDLNNAVASAQIREKPDLIKQGRPAGNPALTPPAVDTETGEVNKTEQFDRPSVPRAAPVEPISAQTAREQIEQQPLDVMTLDEWERQRAAEAAEDVRLGGERPGFATPTGEDVAAFDERAGFTTPTGADIAAPVVPTVGVPVQTQPLTPAEIATNVPSEAPFPERSLSLRQMRAASDIRSSTYLGRDLALAPRGATELRRTSIGSALRHGVDPVPSPLLSTRDDAALLTHEVARRDRAATNAALRQRAVAAQRARENRVGFPTDARIDTVRPIVVRGVPSDTVTPLPSTITPTYESSYDPFSQAPAATVTPGTFQQAVADQQILPGDPSPATTGGFVTQTFDYTPIPTDATFPDPVQTDSAGRILGGI